MGTSRPCQQTRLYAVSCQHRTHALVLATNDLRPALRSETAGPQADAGKKPEQAPRARPGRLRIIRQRLSNSGSQSQSHSAWQEYVHRQTTQGQNLNLSFTCEPLPCGLIFHGPAQKATAFHRALGVATAQIAPWFSLASGRQKHEQAFLRRCYHCVPLVKGQMTLAGSQCQRSSKVRPNKPFQRAAGKSQGTVSGTNRTRKR